MTEPQVVGNQEEGGAIVHGSTDRVVAQKVQSVKKQVAAQSCFLVFSIVSGILCIIVFTTFAEEDCESDPIPLKTWFLVVGIVSLVAVLVTCQMLYGMTQVANEHTLKAGVLKEKGPDREAEANQEAQMGSGQAAVGGATLLCAFCIMCLIGLFSLAWGILGLVAAISSNDEEKCKTSVQWYWIIFCINIASQCFINCANQALKPKQGE